MARDRNDGYDRRTWSVVSVLSAAVGRLRRNPSVLVPFAVAGMVLSVVDALRRRDPIPTLEYGGLDEATVYVEFPGYPTGVNRTTLPLESLVGLEAPYLAWGFGLYALSVVAVSLAGVITLTRLLDGETRLGPLPSYLGFVVGIDLAYRLLESIDALQQMGLFGLVPLAALFAVVVWLFPVPGLVAAGASPWTAIRHAGIWTRGVRWSVLGVILVLGIGTWLLTSVPVIGAFLGSALVAPVHAVAIVSLFEHRRDGWAGTPIEP
ncbi:hypothetical protein [Natronorubrum halophilum]|uniref:hypothetical protein n=1 Tax=Natronorubrum halophilum TaxID=1702106 RepID=UPI0010C23869|nr:hypothetical protein [Natronorubrum halophilum]